MFAFDALASANHGIAAAAPGVTIESRRVAVMLDTRGDPENQAFVRGINDALGLALPVTPNTAGGDVMRRVLWLGPDQWLIASMQPIAHPKIPGASTTDVSHGRAVLRASGAEVRAALAKGCPLDLDPGMSMRSRAAITSPRSPRRACSMPAAMRWTRV
jgi:sarcosine oxidase gamma subunit